MEKVRGLGASVLVRHIRSRDVAPDWQQDEQNQDLQLLLEASRKSTLHLIGYYWHMTDALSAAEHPDWVCRDMRGRPQEHKRGLFMDITGPYREVVLQSLRRAAAAGFETFYFDHQHLPPDSCRGTRLEAAYREQYKAELPHPRSTAPEAIQWRQFRAQEVTATFRYWEDGVRENYPNVTFIVSAASLPALMKPEITTSLVSRFPAKIEFTSAIRTGQTGGVFKRDTHLAVPERDIRIAAGLAVVRDASGGLPPHVWSPGFPNYEHALGFASAVVTHGGIANMDIADSYLLGRAIPENNTPERALRRTFELGNQISHHLTRTRPIRWAGVHFSEQARDELWPHDDKAWELVLWPFIGAYGELLRNGIPVGVINDTQLAAGNLDDYKLLVLPNPEILDAFQQTAVENFQANGGIVVNNNPTWRWHDPETNTNAREAFNKAISSHLTDAPVRLADSPRTVHVVAHQPVEDSLEYVLVAITPNFSWVQSLYLGDDTVNGDGIEPWPGPVDTGVTVELHGAKWKQVRQVKAREVVSGSPVEVESFDGGIRFKLPQLAHLALVRVEPLR